ncbi:hypothetical protein KFK09_002927 [Dendrobium nobile]|uniref:PGG domain-containing protein n=1 Tax=Dendrobium nobile TaxID=94219 RepID=A0A8T3C2Q7_DENNO|nr:hypothetical protein KFK09_002927 [Dendrobium nobile]
MESRRFIWRRKEAQWRPCKFCLNVRWWIIEDLEGKLLCMLPSVEAMVRAWELQWRLIKTVRRILSLLISGASHTPLDIASSCANSDCRLRMKNICKELTSAGSKFGTHRMDNLMGKDQRQSSKEELNQYRTLASNLSLVAGLIATVTFAAGFTLPGGYNSDDSNQGQGMAILAKKLAFKVFLISDTISMLSSISITCLLICTNSLEKDIRSHSIIMAIKFMWVALGGMLVAFSMGIYVVVVSKCRWLAVLICGVAFFIPFMTYMIAYWPTFSFINSYFKVKKPKSQLRVLDFISSKSPTSHSKSSE